MKSRQVQIQTIPIAPNQIFRANAHFFTGYFILGVLSLIAGFVGWIAFRVQLGISESAHLVPISKTLLFVSIAFLASSFVFLSVAFIQYIRIFRFRISGTLSTVVVLQLLTLVLVGLVIADIRKSFLDCVPPAYKFSPVYNRCVPVCPRGYYLDTTKFVCVPGCDSDSDCKSPSEVCTNGKCCDLSSHTITSDGQCCPNADVVEMENGVTVCCPTGKLCGNECCLDADAVCDTTTNQCRVPCGSNSSCPSSQVCVEDPAINFQQCVPKNLEPAKDSACEIVQTSTIPDLPTTDFFPAIKNKHGLSDKALTCNAYDTTSPTNCRNDILQTIRTQDPSILGYTCGLSSPVQFKSTLMKGNCNLQDFMQVIDPVATDKVHVIQVDDEHIVVNQRLNPLRRSSTTGCEYGTYQPSCGGCAPDQCPFQHDSKTMICQNVDGIGMVKDIAVRPRCDVIATAQDASNKTSWNFMTLSDSDVLMYGSFYHLKANDESSKFNQRFLSAQGTAQAPRMATEAWKWRILPTKALTNEDHVVRTGDVVVLQSYESVGVSPQKYDRAYLSTKGSYHQPSMNVGENASAVEDGTPTMHEQWLLLDETYILGKPLSSKDGIFVIKYVGNDPKVAFGNMAMSITGSAPTAPYMMGHVRSLQYKCSKEPVDPRNECPKNGKCELPTFDVSTFECRSISGDTKPLFCRQVGQDNVVQAMCCDTKNFQQFLNDTPNFRSIMACDTDGNDTQLPLYGDSRHRMFCTTPQQLPIAGNMDIQSLNEKNWVFSSSS